MNKKDFDQELELFEDGEIVATYSEEEAEKLGIKDFLESAGSDVNQ